MSKVTQLKLKFIGLFATVHCLLPGESETALLPDLPFVQGSQISDLSRQPNF